MTRKTSKTLSGEPILAMAVEEPILAVAVEEDKCDGECCAPTEGLPAERWCVPVKHGEYVLRGFSPPSMINDHLTYRPQWIAPDPGLREIGDEELKIAVAMGWI